MPIDYDDPASYDYDVPASQIAIAPTARRADSRLLCIDGLQMHDSHVRDIGAVLRRGDLLVVNDARVSPVRVACRRETGGAVEVFALGFADEGDWTGDGERLIGMLRSSKRLRAGEMLWLAEDRSGQVDSASINQPTEPSLQFEGRDARGRAQLRVIRGDAWALFETSGQVPLPPYIVKRRAELRGEGSSATGDVDDTERYQTVFAQAPGAVAAPTAGLHFDGPLLAALEQQGVRLATVTLWVGVGTFRPVTADSLRDHDMHHERYDVPAATVDAIRQTQARGGRVVAVGTTVVRTLEAACIARSFADADGQTEAGSKEPKRTLPRAGLGSTDLFIRPGFRFSVIDALLTNLHLPRSTLLTLVSAFAGYDTTMQAYRHAVRAGYRFYSYGDAMFLTRSEGDEPAAATSAEIRRGDA